jgi:hypothetical protein
MAEELSRSLRDVMNTSNLPGEFLAEPIIEEKVIEVFVPVYEKEIIEVPQVCYSYQYITHLFFRSNISTR